MSRWWYSNVQVEAHSMFIAIVGTPSSGKRTILEYLKHHHGFQEITLSANAAAKVRQTSTSICFVSHCRSLNRLKSSYKTSPWLHRLRPWSV